MGELELLPELIDDRALRSDDEDEFGHTDFVAELSALVLGVDPPASVALYGAWGSGKSGISNLLRARLQRNCDVRYAHFDAFKYAEAPLRRKFLSQIAEELNDDDERFRSGLYSDTRTSSLRIPPVDVLKLLGVFLLVIAMVEAIALGVIVVIAALAQGPFHDDLDRLISAGLALAFAPAALLSAVVALAGRTFPVETTVTAPSSDEQFESLFKDLVTRTRAERVVIFIDELDRCSAKEVVATLETIRTFLDVAPCVFVVAADQQVLEQALRREVRQATPIDVTNPYYSAGSAYLDKIFQFQLSLPPFMPRRLTAYARRLTDNRAGVWREINRDEVVSVLIPTHVTSPRRVKILLNSFALAYRLASRRAEASTLAGGLPHRAPELAKLVCLRAEFPLFAADLPSDPRLTDVVRLIAEGKEAEIPAIIPAELTKRAARYVAGELLTDELLVEQPSRERD